MPSFRGLTLHVLLVRVQSLTPEMKAVLDQHNVYRCLHNVPNLVWDSEVAANAQAWADKGLFDHSPENQRVINGSQCGESLYWGEPVAVGSDAVGVWYSEIESTSPYGLAKSILDTKDSVKHRQVGHYTQVVWKSTTKVGCGKGRAAIQSKSGDLWVCQYCSSGNVVGQFSANVFPASREMAACGAQPMDLPSNWKTSVSVVASVRSSEPESHEEAWTLGLQDALASLRDFQLQAFQPVANQMRAKPLVCCALVGMLLSAIVLYPRRRIGNVGQDNTSNLVAELSHNVAE